MFEPVDLINRLNWLKYAITKDKKNPNSAITQYWTHKYWCLTERERTRERGLNPVFNTIVQCHRLSVYVCVQTACRRMYTCLQRPWWRLVFICMLLCVYTVHTLTTLEVASRGACVLYSYNETCTCVRVCVLVPFGQVTRNLLLSDSNRWTSYYGNVHTDTHRHSELYGNVNSVSPENAAFDPTVHTSLLLPLLHLHLRLLLLFLPKPLFLLRSCIKWQQIWWQDILLLHFLHLDWEQREWEHAWYLKLKTKSESERKNKESLSQVKFALYLHCHRTYSWQS